MTTATRFLSMRELRTSTGGIKDMLADGGKIILTTGGKPTAFMVSVDENTIEETLNAWQRILAQRAFRQLQQEAAEGNLQDMALDEINAEIAASRLERKQKRNAL
jgi:antitoxin (DNA-binding transcriptional repressor) of toxin-antitoxin stability system